MSARAFLYVLFFYSLIGNFCCYGVSFSEIRNQTTQDYKGFYLSQDAAHLALLLFYAGFLANGEKDQVFRTAWQTNIVSPWLDSFSQLSR